MDCDKFESAMMDELYGELDELTSAALRRHVASCTACAGLLEGLRATIRVAAVPRVQPSADLEARILRAAFPSSVPAISAVSMVSAASQEAPPSARGPSVGRRAARALSIAGNWAMRPQTAMAAVFLVMIGTSGLLLRGRSSRAPAGAAVTVTEEGSPAPVAASAGPTGELLAPRMAPAAPLPAAPMAATNGADPLTSAGQGAVAMNGPGDEARSAVALGRAAVHSTAAPKAAAARKGVGGGGSAAVTGEGSFADSRGAATPPPRDEAVAEATPIEGAREAPNFAQPPPAAPPPTVPQSAAAAAAPAAAGASPPAYPGASFDDAMSSYRARRFDDASRTFDTLSASDPRADLWAARAQREGSGCGAAVARFDEVATRAAGTPIGWDAALDGGRCYRFLGNPTAARARLTPLLKVPAYADRARAELSALAHASASGAASGRP